MSFYQGLGAACPAIAGQANTLERAGGDCTRLHEQGDPQCCLGLRQRPRRVSVLLHGELRARLAMWVYYDPRGGRAGGPLQPVCKHAPPARLHLTPAAPSRFLSFRVSRSPRSLLFQSTTPPSFTGSFHAQPAAGLGSQRSLPTMPDHTTPTVVNRRAHGPNAHERAGTHSTAHHSHQTCACALVGICM